MEEQSHLYQLITHNNFKQTEDATCKNWIIERPNGNQCYYKKLIIKLDSFSELSIKLNVLFNLSLCLG